MIRMVWAVPAAVLCGIGARAAPPADLIAPDPEIAAWYKSLRQPGTALPCCSVADCRTVAYRRTASGGYEALVEGTWHTVPQTMVMRHTANPVGKAVACYTFVSGYATLPGASSEARQDHVEILCFVPAEPVSEWQKSNRAAVAANSAPSPIPRT